MTAVVEYVRSIACCRVLISPRNSVALTRHYNTYQSPLCDLTTDDNRIALTHMALTINRLRIATKHQAILACLMVYSYYENERRRSMKLALATWNGRISPVFDVARQVLMLDVEGDRVVTRHEESLPGTDTNAQANRITALAPDTLICGAISQPMAGLLAATHIRVISFTAGNVEEVLAAWLARTLPNPALAMPGCCGQHRRCHGNRAGNRNGRGWTCNKELA